MPIQNFVQAEIYKYLEKAALKLVSERNKHTAPESLYDLVLTASEVRDPILRSFASNLTKDIPEIFELIDRIARLSPERLRQVLELLTYYGSALENVDFSSDADVSDFFGELTYTLIKDLENYLLSDRIEQAWPPPAGRGEMEDLEEAARAASFCYI